MKEIFQMSAKTFYGFEDILFDDLKKIDAIDVMKSNRIVHFKGNKEIMYKANLCLRTALKILLPITLLAASESLPLKTEFKLTNNSGELVPRETTVRPITI